MTNLNILIVEGNDPKNNEFFIKAAKASCSENLKNLVLKLEVVDQKSNPEDIQSVIYSVGKENGYEKNLRDWFKLIYQVLFGEEDGPRMGFFVSFFGLKETIGLINDKIK